MVFSQKQMKSKAKEQMAFSFDAAPQEPEISYRQALVEQIRSDTIALKEETSPWWQEFFQHRIHLYRETIGGL